jgi:hypothetical protein
MGGSMAAGGFTDDIPGMNAGAASVTVHPNEAIVPLSAGRAIPVELPHGWGGQRPGMTDGGWNRGNSTTVVNFNITARDAQSFGRGDTQDQIRARLSAEIAKANQRIGGFTIDDDPTIRPFDNRTPGGRLPNGRNSF